jgi:hypothetical protein
MSPAKITAPPTPLTERSRLGVARTARNDALFGERQRVDALRERLDAAIAKATEARSIGATTRAAAHAAEDVAESATAGG